MCFLDYEFMNRETLSLRDLFEFSTGLGSCQHWKIWGYNVPEAVGILQILNVGCWPKADLGKKFSSVSIGYPDPLLLLRYNLS
jgi:hypothetical protein